MKIGLAWSGNKNHSNDANRSINPDDFLEILPTQACYFSIQKNGTQAKNQSGISLVEMSDHLDCFADTAAICAHMDLVITVDTSLGHLCGALGIPVWIMLPYCADWRWLVHAPQSVWYNSVELIRQPKIGDWDSVFKQVNQKLINLLGT